MRTGEQGFLCINLKSIELFSEPDDEQLRYKVNLRSCRIAVHTKSLALKFADANDEFEVVNDAKPEEFEKWLVALTGLRVHVDYK